MKKILALTVCAMFMLTLAASAQDEGYWKKRYANIGINRATMTQQEVMEATKSNIGFSLSIGRTYYLHKPIANNMLRFGIDATWFDATYRNYTMWGYDWDAWDDWNGRYSDMPSLEKFKLHEASIGMQVGPSLTINPYKKLMAEVYFRYCPSLVIQGGNGEDLDVSYGYGSHFVSGCQISWHCIGLGIEAKFGRAKMNSIFGDDDDYWDDDWADDASSSKKVKTKTKGFRFFLTFRY